MAGFIGLALSYGLSLNVFVVFAVQNWCFLENLITSVERLEQYMHIPGEAAEVIESQRPMHNWPMVGKVKICDLKVIRKNCKEVLLQQVLELCISIYYYMASIRSGIGPMPR
jgi:hypothetical protein